MEYRTNLQRKSFNNKDYVKSISGIIFGESRKKCRLKGLHLRNIKIRKILESAKLISIAAQIESDPDRGTNEISLRASIEQQVENLIGVKSHQPAQQEIFIRKQGVTTTHPAKSSYNSNTEVLEHSDSELLGCERLTSELIAVLEKLKTTRKVKPPVKDKDQAHNFVKREIYLQQLGEKASEIATWVRRCKDCQG